MEIKRTAIKNNAKLLIANSKPSPILVFLVYILISLVIATLSDRISGQYQMMNELLAAYQKGDLRYVPDPPALSVWAYVLLAALGVMAAILLVGATIYSLEICQLRKGSVGNLFDGFGIFWRALGLLLVEGLFIYLWTLLFIIPGIIAAYRYRQALYLLIDNPEFGILECLRRSSQMMVGRKWELFVLDLSFLGWYLLTIIPGAIVWVRPYTCLTYTNYYLALRDMPQSTFDKTV